MPPSYLLIGTLIYMRNRYHCRDKYQMLLIIYMYLREIEVIYLFTCQITKKYII